MKFQISSTCTRLVGRFRSTRSWYAVQACPASTTSFVTVFLLAPDSRVTARIELPSQRRWRIRARISRSSLFMARLYDLFFLTSSIKGQNKRQKGFYSPVVWFNVPAEPYIEGY